MVPLLLAASLAMAPLRAFEYRESAPGSHFPSGMAVQDVSQPGTVSNPALLPLVGFSYLSAAGARPYSLPDMGAQGLRLGLCRQNAGVQASWSRFGIEGYAEQIFGLAGGIRVFGPLALGANAGCSMIGIDIDGFSRTRRIWDGGIAVVLEPFRWLLMTFFQENLAALLFRLRRGTVYPQWNAGLSLRPIRGVDLMYGMSGTAFGLVNSIALSVRLFPFLALGAGYQRETGAASGALSLLFGRVGVSYGFRYHDSLGMTHTLSLTLTLQSREFPSLAGGGGTARPDVTARVDINRCGEEELARVPLISRELRGRIVEYRQSVGPLTRSALLRLGMGEGDADRLCDYAYGLQEERRGSRAEKWRRGTVRAGMAERRRRLFMKMVEAGLPASRAIRLSEMAAAGRGRALREEIDSMTDLTADQKRKIRGLCGY
ncbi:MAG: helix-hairpin-helix domain-containing protein [Spirochaetes bacterium]|nr:helix-hairpin-helix domain-containing protein [Spirochaetota bacterium]